MDMSRTPRTTLKRLPKRGSHEREVIDRILDEGFICHVGSWLMASLCDSYRLRPRRRQTDHPWFASQPHVARVRAGN